MRYLHFFDERNAHEHRRNYDIYHRVRYFFDVVVPKFLNAYQSAREDSIDESMIKSQGRTPGHHFIRNKPICFGQKVYMLAEAKTGYVINIDLAQAVNTVPAGQKIVTTVMNICAPYHDLGYHLYMDNWYTSFGLCVHLWDRSWQCCGITVSMEGRTMLVDRVNNFDNATLQ